jgi:hypothetical protein
VRLGSAAILAAEGKAGSAGIQPAFCGQDGRVPSRGLIYFPTYSPAKSFSSSPAINLKNQSLESS